MPDSPKIQASVSVDPELVRESEICTVEIRADVRVDVTGIADEHKDAYAVAIVAKQLQMLRENVAPPTIH